MAWFDAPRQGRLGMDWLIYILGCFLAADFLSGVFHWLEDRYFHSDWPVLGKHVAAPNELHHSQPRAFLDQSYWARNWTTILPALAGAGVCAACEPWGCLVFLFLTQANEIHAWAHQAPSKTFAGRWTAALQETGLLQSSRHHAKHHRSPYDMRYCVMTGWINPILDAGGFWLSLEFLLRIVGIKTKGT